jgi:hypothetical protein
MSELKMHSRQRSFILIPELSENTMLTIIALAFLLLHIFAGTILQRTPAGEASTPQQAENPSSFD